ncbi:hypothetical protein DP117_05760 [Brasilonema sp. UFV-L1]|nr:hypothetical protein [Brasilonema sp. UFV-L1]
MKGVGAPGFPEPVLVVAFVISHSNSATPQTLLVLFVQFFYPTAMIYKVLKSTLRRKENSVLSVKSFVIPRRDDEFYPR